MGSLNSNSPNSAHSPFPNMPSQTFITLAESQFELLSNCLVHDTPNIPTNKDASGAIATKVKSMALYLPQENQFSGQLEFIPAIIYPSPQSERIFIANDAETGLPPTIPRTLTTLPGFAHAQTLLPAYPFASRTSGSGGDGGVSVCVGEVEEVMCEPTGCSNGSVLSVPLFHGSRTVGVLLTWPTTPPTSDYKYSTGDETYTEPYSFPWTQGDADQIKRAAYSLGVALQMDEERTTTQTQADHLRVALAENLHQVRNPLQALRTFGKLLQRKIALEEQIFYDQNMLQSIGNSTNTIIPAYMQPNRNDPNQNDRYANSAMILSLAENMMVQSDRVVDLLKPMDSLVLGTNDDKENSNEQQQLAETEKVVSFGRTDPSPSPTMYTEYFTNSTTVDNFSSRYYNNVTDSTAITFGRSSNCRQSSNPSTGQSNATDSSSIVKRKRSEKPQPNIGDLDMEIAFFPDVIHSILSAGEAVATEDEIKFELYVDDDLPGVSVNPKSLQEAISNIINNALKYVVLGKIYDDDESSNNDPRVQVILTPNPPSYKAGVSIIIADNGPGIPQDQWENVFERGCRGDGTIARQVDGSGIGLDVSLSLIARMGGELEIITRDEVVKHGSIGTTVISGALFRAMLFRNPQV